MPDWAPDWDDVEFDHAAATSAAEMCRSTARRVREAVELGLEPSATNARIDWTGLLADEFGVVAPQLNTSFIEVADALDLLAGQIDDAAANAALAQRTRVAERARWRAELAAETASTEGQDLPPRVPS